jgi:mannitol-1-/sugar-/sorbitol-6-phosphatase
VVFVAGSVAESVIMFALAALSCSSILFDLDGVLADSTSAVERHWIQFAHRRGLVPDEVIKSAHGRRSVDVISGLVAPEDVDVEAAWFENLEMLDTADVVALPGATVLIASLPADRWGVVTSCGRDLASARLRAAGLPVPRTLISGDQVIAGKPDPEGYLLGIAELGRGGVTVVFEDAPSGVEAARRAEATVVGLTTTHAAYELDVHHLVADLRSVGVVYARSSLYLKLS